MNTPHGGKLINRIKQQQELDLDNIDLKVVADSDQVAEIRNIATGIYSPLTGYMNEDDFNSVLDKMQLADGVEWTVPIFLPLTTADFDKVKPGSQILFQYEDEDGSLVDYAVMMVESKFEYDQDKYCESVYGTTDPEHPGVKMIHGWEPRAVGGSIWLFGPIPRKYPDFDRVPEETRQIFADKGWKTVVGFQTRNAAHRAHEFIQKMCLEFVDGLFVNPIIGRKKPGDFKDEVILAVYEMLVRDFYPQNSTHISIYNSRMNYAGPKEAIFHAIVRKNFGCTHFIVGRDHAGVGDYYDKLAAHRIFDEFENIGITPMKVSNAFFDTKSDMYTTQKTSPFGPEHWIAPSGTKVRQFIKEQNHEELDKILRPEVLEEILKFDNPFVT